MRLRPLNVTQGDDQDAIGWISELSLQSSPHQYVLHMLVKSVEFTPRAGAVRVPRLHDLGISDSDFTDER